MRLGFLGTGAITSAMVTGLASDLERGIEPHSDEWKLEIEETLKRQKEAMHPRLFPELPKHRYICFYPMDRLRGEDKNWYMVPIEERARLAQRNRGRRKLLFTEERGVHYILPADRRRAAYLRAVKSKKHALREKSIR